MRAERWADVVGRRGMAIGVATGATVAAALVLALTGSSSPDAGASPGGRATPTSTSTVTPPPATTTASSSTTSTTTSTTGATTSTTGPTSSTATSTTTTAVTTTTVDPSEPLATLVEGDSGPDVVVLQRMLIAVAGAELVADGVYGASTTAAVLRFQRSVDLPPTGVADDTTRRVLLWLDRGRSTVLPPWPIPSIGDGGADGCQVAMIGDSLMAGATRLHADRLREIGCAAAVDAVGGRSLSRGWQCQLPRSDGRLRLVLVPERIPDNGTCAPSGLELLGIWSSARALGDVVVVALGTNDAGLLDQVQWTSRWERALALAGTRPVVFVTTQAHAGSTRVDVQSAYSVALRRWCAGVPRCVLADWAITPTALDPTSYRDSVHLTASATDARASFLRDVVAALLSGRPIPNPAPLPTPTTPQATVPTTSTTTAPTAATTTTATTSTTTRPTTTTSTTSPTTTTSTTTTSPTTTTTTTSTTTTSPTTTVASTTTIAAG